ncbi:putative transcriptional regulatory protein [Oceanicola granulosus HTCC2516]|uniref:Putative transcriptional regulatory protein n=1 Tax=Oceanicola granulosus (strain ATCC BAA-861 / DSM 15982 / KCTC 12143 / HTCC2516) TaxID=314256 RepID=Q2CH61_OCEGH|nr:sugar-binding domain-containing protein [Oceanicola granulosus]EAR51950.1 putative transcriptional regulatory protein [Oceanicola granulosus HTCC2516]
MGQQPQSSIPRHTLSHVAMLYYREGLTQGEIARRVGLSRATVVNYLRLARETGIVDIRINGDSFADSRLARDLAARWGLEAAFVAHADEAESGAMLATLAQMAALAVHDLLAPGARLGVAWGETVQRVAHALAIRPVVDLAVHQLVGSMYDTQLQAAENCTVEIARKCGADCRTLHAPAILSSADLAAALRAEPIIARQLARFDDLSHALFSVGDVGQSTTIVTSGIASADEVARYAADGARAVLCGHFIDDTGNVMETPLSARMIGITPAQLSRVPVRLLVAGGDEKVAPLRALLHGGYASHLLVDEKTAAALLD